MVARTVARPIARSIARAIAGGLAEFPMALSPGGVSTQFGTERSQTTALGSLYQRNGALNVLTTSDGRDTAYTTLDAHEISGKPRTVKNILADADITDISTWNEFTATADSYNGNGEFTISGLVENNAAVGASTDGALPSESIEDRDFVGVAYLRATSAADVGKTARLYTVRDTGGTAAPSISNDVTLTESWTPCATPVLTGGSAHLGVRVGVLGGVTNSVTEVEIKYPTIIEVTGQNDQNPVMPIPVDTPTGPEFIPNPMDYSSWTVLDGAGSQDGSAISLDRDGGGAYQIAKALSYDLVAGKTYVFSITTTAQTHNVSLYLDTDTTPAGAEVEFSATSVGTTHFAHTVTTGGTYNAILGATGNSAATATVTALSLREATTGLLESDYTNPVRSFGGVLVEDELSWLELDQTSGEGASKDSVDDYSSASTLSIYLTTSFDDISDGANRWVFGAWDAATNERGFAFGKTFENKLGLVVSDNGTTSGNVTASTTLPTLGLASGVLYHFKVDYVVSTGAGSLYYAPFSAGATARDVPDSEWIAVADDGVTGRTTVYVPSAKLTVGAIADNLTGGVVGGNVIYAGIYADDVKVDDFVAATAIADGWTIHNAGGAAQIKTNARLPLHAIERTVQPGVSPANAYAVRKHFPLSTALYTKDQHDPDNSKFGKLISSLANATYPNGSQGIFNQVEAFPNLIPPAARVDFAGEWTQTGTGSITPVGDGTELVANGTFDTDSGWTDFEAGSSTATIQNGRLEIFDDGSNAVYSYQELTVEEGEWYVFVGSETKGDVGVTIRIGESANGTEMVGTSISAGTTKRILFRATASTIYVTFFRNGATNTVYVDDVSVQKLSYTTLSDEDDSANEAVWALDVTIPTDDEYYSASVTLSQGTADVTDIRVRYRNTVNVTERWRYTWATGDLSSAVSEATGATATATTNADGTVTIEITGADNQANTAAQIAIYPAGVDASIQGTVNVHGDVVLQRVSAAAEPTWNTRKPGDSVVQYVLQQNDPDTTWTDLNTPVVTSGVSDPFGGTDAFSVEDNSATLFEAVSQALTVAASSNNRVMWAMVKKTASASYPAIRLVETTTNDGEVVLQINSFTGEVDFETGDEGDAAGSVDLAAFGGTFAGRTVVDDGWWVVWFRRAADSTETALTCFCYGQTSTGIGTTNDNTVQGTGTFCYPSVHEGDYPYFFDSIATTATVTEVVQDWSKIFTFLTEASNNACNMVFSHGFHRAMGIPNSTALTNEVSTPYHVASSEADWSVSGTFTSQTDVDSPLDGQKGVEFVGDGASDAYVAQAIGTFTAATETYAIYIAEGDSPPDETFLLIYDTTALGTVIRVDFDWSTYTAAVNSGSGTSKEAFVRPLGTTGDGRRQFIVYARCVPANSGNNRQFRVYPNGVGISHDSGDNTIVYWAGAVESDVVSILPWPGTRVAQTWSYDSANRANAAGTLLADYLLTLGATDMAVSSDMALFGDSNGTGEALLQIDNAERFRTDDGTSNKQCTTTIAALNVMRVAVGYSSAEDEHGIICNGGGAITGAYDGAWAEPLNVFADTKYEAHLLNLFLSKKYSNSAGRTALVEYD